jgi:hypothetical protein
MLYEMIAEQIPNAVPIMQNTDGLETLIPREYVDKYYEICAEWEKITNLQLEHDTYQKIVLGDVNNYIAVNEYKEIHPDLVEKMKNDYPDDLFKEEGGKHYHAGTKCKGRFEFNNLALHKNKSFLIIPKALFYYFVHGIEPWVTITANTNIFDFCGGVKIKGDWKFEECFIKKEIDPTYASYTLQQKKDYLKANGWEMSWSDNNWVRSNATNKEANTGISTEAAFNFIVPKVGGQYMEVPMQHTIRYYISKTGSKIIKKNNSDGREIQVEAGRWMQTTMIDYVDKPFEEYDINYDYYLDKVTKEIEGLEPKTTQLRLF